jgi:hypothetical protein
MEPIVKPFFRMPTPVSIMARSSSITNSFINAVIPTVTPTDTDIVDALRILEMSPADVRCAYCGDKATEWDHLRPLVVRQKPTGYISEIGNLIPACGKCNQSKGNKPWRAGMESSAPQSPARRQVTDLNARIDRIERYEQWRPPIALNFGAAVDPAMWAEHWKNWERVLAAMRESQKLASEIRQLLKSWHAPAVRDIHHVDSA